MVDPWSEEWDPWRANNRSLATMRHIALEALKFKEEDAAYYRYAAEHNLTINEVVYYLNAYEYGGDAGLEASAIPISFPRSWPGAASNPSPGC